MTTTNQRKAALLEKQGRNPSSICSIKRNIQSCLLAAVPASLSQTDTGSMRVSGSVLCSQALEHAEDIFFFLLQAGYLLFKFKDPCVFVLVIRLTIGNRKIPVCQNRCQ